MTPRAMRAASQREAVELTPTPMVIGEIVESVRRGVVGGHDIDRVPRPSQELPVTREMPIVERASARVALAPPATINQQNLAFPISYHPPRKPPSSVIPPAPEVSFSVAPEYDPRAPTKPRVRRVSTRPPPPLLFGLDRMLVWGMVLGGLFVAAVVVLVHRLAPSESNESDRGDRSRNATPLASGKPWSEPSSRVEQTVPSSDTIGSAAPPAHDAGVVVKRGGSSVSSTKSVRSGVPQQPGQKPTTDKRAKIWIE